MRARAGSTVSKRVTVAPASARARVRAVRKMVSPSGMSGGLRGGLCQGGFGDVAHLEAEGRWDEAGLFEEAGQEVFACRRIVDFADEQAGAAGLTADGDFGELAGEFARVAGEVGLVLRQDDLDGRIAAAQEGGERAIDEDDAAARGARHGVIYAGPGQQAAIRVGGVAGGEMQGFGTLGDRKSTRL